jgi:hypothetical protein
MLWLFLAGRWIVSTAALNLGTPVLSRYQGRYL